MPAGSERISTRWVEGADRVCIKCGVEIKNLSQQVGEVRSRIVDGKTVREIICMDCPGRKVRKEE